MTEAVKALNESVTGVVEMSHTPEPWEVTALRYIRQSNDPRHVVARAAKMDGMEANARRIVAAVNACATMPTDDLEEMVKQGGNVRVLAEFADHLRQQRDKLLAALELLLERMELPPDRNCSCHISLPCNDCVDYSGIREAIKYAEKVLAEVKGQS